LNGIETHISLGIYICNKAKCMTSATLKPVGEGESGKFLVSFLKITLKIEMHLWPHFPPFLSPRELVRV